ncbi:MAG: zinc ABC transporter substrate-binding protein [Methanotrichaceae archaeon]|nr:zinc ABC transporter substrate-binding protein [Methanotrichaceae archaeon]
MIGNINKSISILVLLLAVTILSGCISQDESSPAAPSGAVSAAPSGNASDKISVAVTIAPLGEFVRAVGGEKVVVTVIVPPGAEPHTFEPTPSLMVDMAKADLYVMNGAGLEFWMDKLLGANKRMVVVDSSQGISLLQESEDEIDPHIWLSLRNAAIQVENICSGLIEIDPQNKDYYIKNRDDYLGKLKALDEELGQTFAGKRAKIFIVQHPAWTYFARDYDLRQVPLMEGEKEPGPRYLGEVIELARKNNITAVFVEPQFNPKSAEVIGREMNARIVALDPLAGNYLDNMRYASREIAQS